MSQRIVYHYRRDLGAKRVCDLGCRHRITFHERKRITIVSEHQELIPFLNYDRPALGTVYEATDAQGRTYIGKPSFDSPVSWVRSDGKAFFSRPVIRMDAAFTLDNRLIR